MRGVNTYCRQGKDIPVRRFVDSLDPKLREKLLRQIIMLSVLPCSEWKEPHYKHFSIERYRSLYEVREKGKVLVRVIFSVQEDGSILLLHAFIKRQKRDTMQALEQSLRILTEIRDNPESAVEFKIIEEEKQ